LGGPDGDRNAVFWLKSRPPTESSRHEVSNGWSVVDEYKLNVNLGYDATVGPKGDINFNYTHRFTAEYSEKRDITDWSVIEKTDPETSEGNWQFYQQWPTDMMILDTENFPTYWELFFEKAWNPCKVKDVPNLSKYTMTTHNTMLWGVDPSKGSVNGRELPVTFKIQLKPCYTGITCEDYNGHHTMVQDCFNYDNLEYTLNVANLNNIVFSQE
jgi:hypothetical protein